MRGGLGVRSDLDFFVLTVADGTAGSDGKTPFQCPGGIAWPCRTYVVVKGGRAGIVQLGECCVEQGSFTMVGTGSYDCFSQGNSCRSRGFGLVGLVKQAVQIFPELDGLISRSAQQIKI